MSEIIVESLEMYNEQEESEIDPYTLGLPYFGKYNLGDSDLSTTYKKRLREFIRERQNSLNYTLFPSNLIRAEI